MASMLIYGRQDAVLTDPGMTEDQARVLGDRVAGKGRDCQPSGLVERSASSATSWPFCGPVREQEGRADGRHTGQELLIAPH